MPVSFLSAYFGLLAILAVLLPLGLLLARAGERLLGVSFSLTPIERGLVALYLAGTLLIALASTPAPLFGGEMVWALAGGGAVALAVLWIHERFRGLKLAWARVPGPSYLALTVLFLGLLGLEIFATGSFAFPNAYDGSYQSLFVQILLTHHAAAWTLEPYAAFGVTYPQGAEVWLSLPVLFFHWPVATSPVVLPLLFLSLSVPATYCWGERLGGVGTGRGRRCGLLFAAFFALIGSWPRLFVGGSYDFAIALPLFFVGLGAVLPLVTYRSLRWRHVAAFGFLSGMITVLSLAAGEALLLVTAASVLMVRGPDAAPLRTWLARGAAVASIAALFVSRSIAGVVVWFRYPQHVMSPLGNPPYATQPGLPTLNLGEVMGNLDPFVPFKIKISPLPLMSLLGAALLAGGLFLLIWFFLRRASPLARSLPGNSVRVLTAAPVSMLAWTGFLLLASATSTGPRFFDSFSSLYESSFLLFIGFQAIAILPLLTAAEVLAGRRPPSPSAPTGGGRRVTPLPRTARLRTAGPVTLALVALLVVPMAVGLGTSATQVPAYLHDHLLDYANVTAADVAALAWAGSNLPQCSRVFVAPGSAALFLPLYSTVAVDFPMATLSLNLSYNIAVENLTSGTYSSLTRTALEELGITVVFATGQTSISYAPIDTAPLLGSPDFRVLFRQGDAAVFEFLPGAAATGCPA